MKRKITLLMALAASAIHMQAQLVFSESFTAPFNPPAAGWSVQNLSAPIGTNSWFQGTTNQFTALSGALTDYFAANYNSTAGVGANNTISNWLITPTLTLMNGAVIEFASRCGTVPNVFADRLQLYYSTAGNGTNVGATAGTATNSAGTFTNILLDINPTLNFWDYPISWTIYTATVTGLAAPVVGRMAFRYYVTNGGNGGVNSNYVGIDDVRYSLPCNFPNTQIAQTTFSVCAGSSASLGVATGSALVSYTWSVGTNTSPVIANPTVNVTPIVVSPTLNTIYILTGESPPGCYSRTLVTVNQGVAPVIQAPSFTVCSNPVPTVTLSASGGASYVWNTGATTSSTTVTPNATTIYTVNGMFAGSSCAAAKEVTVTLGNSLSIGVSATFTNICSGFWVTLNAASAATNYLWSTGGSSSAITVTPGVTTTYTVGGMAGNCIGSNSITIVVNATPTLSVLFTPTAVCSGLVNTITPSGAVTYSYDINNPNPILSSGPSATFTAPNASLTPSIFIAVFGTAANGCGGFAGLTVTINPNPTVTVVASKSVICTGSAVTLTASGASSYAWSGAVSATASPFSYTGTAQGSYQFLVTGTSTNGCRNSAVTTVSVSKCTGINEEEQESLLGSVFPNPFSAEIQLSGIQGRVVIYNALGQIVIQADVSGSQNIDTSGLPTGMYILKVYAPQGIREKAIKLIKD